jgi:putative SOS response-associated peptidase YedK
MAGRKDVVWFARSPERPLFAFAGIWTEWTGARGTKANPVEGTHMLFMTTAEDIEKAVEQLTPRELAKFCAWFEMFQAERFDAAIARDAEAAKLDGLAEEALAAHRAGKSHEFWSRRVAVLLGCV